MLPSPATALMMIRACRLLANFGLAKPISSARTSSCLPTECIGQLCFMPWAFPTSRCRGKAHGMKHIWPIHSVGRHEDVLADDMGFAGPKLAKSRQARIIIRAVTGEGNIV